MSFTLIVRASFFMLVWKETLDIIWPKAFAYNVFNIIIRQIATRKNDKHKKPYQRVKNKVDWISTDDVQWRPDHCQVCMVYCQNTTLSFLQPIVTLNIHERRQADLINIPFKRNSFYFWIFVIKEHFSKHTMFYARKSKKISKIANCISLYLHYFWFPTTFQYNSSWESRVLY